MLEKQINETVEYIRSKIGTVPEAAIVLGSGLGGFADQLEDAVRIPYEEIPGFVRSTAPGHKGQIVCGKKSGRVVLCMQGRFHYYEGYTMQQVTYPVRVIKALGIPKLILTNSCGGLNPEFEPGDLMLITDHINFMGANPLIGPNEDMFGCRFPDMTKAYNKELAEKARKCAGELSIDLKEGTYVGYSGPSFETPAEIRMFQMLGGSAVGMSTVPEVIAASHCGLNVLALSCITNLAAGILDQPLSAEEVIEVAGKAGKKFTGLLEKIVEII